MKYKEGDKVRILVGGDSHPAPHYLGYKGVIGTIMDVRFDKQYMVELPDSTICYYEEREVELAPPIRYPPKKADTCTMTLIDSTGQPYEALFVDVGVEMFRSYLFPATLMPDGRVFQERIVRVDKPKWLYVAPSGSHRIVDKDGRSHYIPAGWRHLWWLPEKGQPPHA